MNFQAQIRAAANGLALAHNSEERHLVEAALTAEMHFSNNSHLWIKKMRLGNDRLVLIRRDGLFSMRGFDDETGLLLFACTPSAPFVLSADGVNSIKRMRRGPLGK